MNGYSTLSDGGVPYVVLGEQTPSILVVPGIEPEHRVPDGLRLQGVRGAFEQLAELRSIAVAWRAVRDPQDVTIDSIAGDYVALAHELELADLTIVGISTGCPMAIETAARLAGRCTRLVLISGGAFLSQQGRALLERSVALAQAGYWRTLAREQIAAFYPGLLGSYLLAPVAWLFPGLYGRPADVSHFVSLTTTVARTDLRNRCADVAARSLVINGELDRFYPPDIARETALLLADGDYVTIPGAGHGAFKSHAARIVKLLVAYLVDDQL